MAKSFSNPTFYNSGKPTFGNTINTDDSGNYTRNKKAKLLYRHNFNGFNFAGVLGSQNNYLLFQRAKVIRNETCASCPMLTSFDSSNLVAGLYTNEKLGGVINGKTWGVNVIGSSDNDPCNNVYYTPTNIIAANIYPKNATTPFYWKYKIDPCGSLFGNAPCGYDNYEDYRVISKPVVTTAASLKDCCVATCFTENILQQGLCNEVCAYNNIPNILITTGNPTITNLNGFTVLTFTTSGSFQFLGAGKNIGYIVAGGGGAGGGGYATSNTGSGGGGGGGVTYISTNTYSISPNNYTITIGNGGIGASNASGGAGEVSSIVGSSVNITANGGGGGQLGTAPGGAGPGQGGVAGSGGGNGGIGYNAGNPVDGFGNGINGTTITTNYGSTLLVSSGGSGGNANHYGSPGSNSGGGVYPTTGGANGNGVAATYYGCGGGASSGDGRRQTGGARTGGNGAPGVVIVWFST